MDTLLPRTFLALCLLMSACTDNQSTLTFKERAARFNALNKEGTALCGKFAYREALDAYQSALALCDRTAYPLPWSNTAKDAAWTLRQLGKHDQAEALYREILAHNEQSIGKDSPETLDTIDSLLSLLSLRNDLTESASLQRRLVTIHEANLARNTPEERNSGRDSRLLSSRLERLGVLLESSQRFDEAEPLIRKALQVEVACQIKTKTTNTGINSLQASYRTLLLKMGDTDEQAQEKIDKIMEPLSKK